jgi:hypothetical protein
MTHFDIANREFDFWNHFCSINNLFSKQSSTLSFKTDLKNTLELPEWYDTERDQDMVKEYVNEYDVFFNPELTIEEEIEKEHEDITPENDTESSDEDTDNEWLMA